MRPCPRLETDRELEGTHAHQHSTGLLASFVAGIRMINGLFPGSKRCDKYKAWTMGNCIKWQEDEGFAEILAFSDDLKRTQ